MTFLLYFSTLCTAFSANLYEYVPSNAGSGIEDMVQTVFFGIIGVLGIAVSIYLILSYRKNERFNVFLGIFTLTTALILIELALFWWEGINYNPKVPFYKSLIFVWGPSLYLYLKGKAQPRNKNTSYPSILQHYIIFVVSLLLLSIIWKYRYGL